MWFQPMWACLGEIKNKVLPTIMHIAVSFSRIELDCLEKELLRFSFLTLK